MNRGTIYLILNKQTEHKYIGYTTTTMNKEWVNHIERSKRMSSEPLHKAFREYGVHNFMIKEIDECDDILSEHITKQWIEKYQPEYNEIKKPEPPPPPPEPIEIKQKRPQNTSHLKPFTKENRSDGKHSGLRIRGKNLETGKVYEWESARVAAEQVTGDPKKNSNILVCARRGFKYYGYKWQILEDKKKKKSVFGVNKKAEQIEVRFESIAAAVRALRGTAGGTGIMKSLRHPGRFSWHGYYWFYD